MIALLAKFLIPNRFEYADPAVRRAYGTLCGAVGIALNALLFAVKFLAGRLTGSIAITADAFNNLTDAGSSLVSIIGFRMAGQKPDPDHPFGHGRMEYITGLIIAGAILLTGYELFSSSIESIRNPEAVEFTWLSFGILIAAIAVKFYMFLYNRQAGRKIDSSTVRACASDSLNDALSTAIVLLGMLASRYFGWHIDGWCGLFVSAFILKGGFDAARETVGQLLGGPPDPELVREIEETVLKYEGIYAIHDLVVHDYGAGRLMITLHAEVSADGDMLSLHDQIDNAERELQQKLGCFATIHMDPIRTSDSENSEIYHKVRAMVHDFDGELSMHDFRMVEGPTHTNLIFDVVAPHKFRLTDRQLVAELSERVRNLGDQYYAVIQVDKKFTK